MRNRPFILLLALTTAVVAGLTPGCRTAKKAVGTYEVFMQGRPDQVVSATQAALKELKIEELSADATKVDGEVRARSAQGKNITIKVATESEGVSKFTVRVGKAGDRTISNAIIDKTRENLR